MHAYVHVCMHNYSPHRQQEPLEPPQIPACSCFAVNMVSPTQLSEGHVTRSGGGQCSSFVLPVSCGGVRVVTNERHICERLTIATIITCDRGNEVLGKKPIPWLQFPLVSGSVYTLALVHPEVDVGR